MSGFVQLNTGTATPSGSASGDLSGTFPSPTVVGLTGASNIIAIHGNSISFDATSTTPLFNQLTAATGSAGQVMTIKAQTSGATSSAAGAILKIGGGGGAVSGTNAAGDTQIDLGAVVSGVSAKCSLLVGGASVLDMYQSASSVTWIKSSARLQLSGTQLNITDNSANPLISYNISDTSINLFKEIHFNSVTPKIIHNITGGTGAAAGATMLIQPQQGQAQTGVTTNNNGGILSLLGGLAGTGGSGAVGNAGAVQIGPNTSIIIEATQFATATQNIISLCRKSALTTTQMPANTGDGVIYIANAATAPTANAVSGGILYASSGALIWRSPGGTTTTIAPS